MQKKIIYDLINQTLREVEEIGAHSYPATDPDISGRGAKTQPASPRGEPRGKMRLENSGKNPTSLLRGFL